MEFKKGDKIRLINTKSDTIFYTSKVGDIGEVDYVQSDKVFLTTINGKKCDKKWGLEDVELITETNIKEKSKNKLFNYNHY